MTTVQKYCKIFKAQFEKILKDNARVIEISDKNLAKLLKQTEKEV